MNKVSFCILVNGDYASTVYSFERSGFLIVKKEVEIVIKDSPIEYINTIDNVEIQLVVGIKHGIDKRLIDYFSKIATDIIFLDDTDNEAISYNKMFRKCKNEFVCIFKTGVFLQPHWLNELICYLKLVKNSGIVSICNNYTELEYLPLLSSDNENFINVFIQKDNFINKNGVILFLREYLYLVGCLNEQQKLIGNELYELQLRYMALGFNNFYIPNQSLLNINQTHEIDKTELNESINEMRKNKNYYLPL